MFAYLWKRSILRVNICLKMGQKCQKNIKGSIKINSIDFWPKINRNKPQIQSPACLLVEAGLVFILTAWNWL
jgi:hypothetical protein